MRYLLFFLIWLPLFTCVEYDRNNPLDPGGIAYLGHVTNAAIDTQTVYGKFIATVDTLLYGRDTLFQKDSLYVATVNDSIAFSCEIPAEKFIRDISWDFNNDGTYDSHFFPNKPVWFVFPAPGLFHPVVRVTGENGDRQFDTAKILIVDDIPSSRVNGDTNISINDPFWMHGSGGDGYGRIFMYRFDSDGDGRFEDSSTGSGEKKLTAPSVPGSYNAIFQVEDDDGNVTNDTMILHVRLDPPTADAGKDATLGRKDTLRLHAGESADIFGEIVKYEWDIGNTGNFLVCFRGETSFVVPNDNFECVLRVTDNDGVEDRDTALIRFHSFEKATNDAPFGNRYGHGSVAFDNKLWVIGGNVDGVDKNDVWYSLNGTNWVQATGDAGFPKRQSHASVVFDNKIWVIGGTDNTTGGKNDVWYSADGIHWTQSASAAGFSKRYGHSSVVFNGTMWIIGGKGCNDSWYSGDGAAWVQIADTLPFGGRHAHTSMVFDNKMWVIAGYDDNDETSKNDIWNSSDGTNWEQITGNADFDERSAHASTVFDGKMWVIGGMTFDVAGPSAKNLKNMRSAGSIPGINVKSDIWYSVDGKTWTRISASSGFSGRFGHAAVSFSNRIWIIGGYAEKDVWYSEPITYP